MSRSLLEQGRLPIASLARIGRREGWRPSETYSAHRWFARRLASAVRALLVASQTSTEESFWQGYEKGMDLGGLTVFDPFVGGGTSVIEAQRLGANTLGVDVDAVACAITSFESRAHTVGDLNPSLDELKRSVGSRLARYYETRDATGEPRVVLHCFWVQVVECGGCSRRVDAHPHYQLAYEAEGHYQWVFCPACTEIVRLPKSAMRHKCQCGCKFNVRSGTVERGVLTCPHCKQREALIDVARRTGTSPVWRSFALETLSPDCGSRTPLSERSFQRVTDYDLGRYEAAHRALLRQIKRAGSGAVPIRHIPQRNRSDRRLVGYGYRTYSELFNSRQLLHLSLLSEAIVQQPAAAREALIIAFSDHLTTNCMMTNYAFGWRRLAPLFSIRAFRHVPRPVELNPWLDGTGRGTYPNAVRQVMRSVSSARSAIGDPSQTATRSVIVQRDSRDLSHIKSNSVDIVLTDPPYFDNIAYSELSDFFIPWMKHFGLIRSAAAASRGRHQSIAAPSRRGRSISDYAVALRECFAEMSRVLAPHGTAIFTYQHRTPQAWQALMRAISQQRMRVVQVFPILGNSAAGPHVDDGTCQWDAVFVLSKREPAAQASGRQILGRAQKHWRSHVTALSRKRNVRFGARDRNSFLRACLTAGGGGLFGTPDSKGRKALLKAIETIGATDKAQS
jgi:putative DNA methylase